MRRANPEQMAKWLAWREQHGWSFPETSRRCGQPAWKLRWWHRRLERAHTTETPSRAFLAVEITDAAPGPPATLEVTTRSGLRVSVPAGFDPEHLRRVLAALDAAC